MSRQIQRLIAPCLLSIVVLGLPAAALASEWSLERQTIASGTTEQAASDDALWDLAATLGQWEATEYAALSGGDWQLTGGFWPVNAESDDDQSEEIFSDRFEG